jgi:hypothetical protein
MMRQSDDDLRPSENRAQLDYEVWRDSLRSMCARYSPEGIEPAEFAGWITPLGVYGFAALNIGANASRVGRSHRDARLEGADHYFVVFQIAGESGISHNDQAIRLAAGDVALVDAARPLTYAAGNEGQPWNTLTLKAERREPTRSRFSDIRRGRLGA